MKTYYNTCPYCGANNDPGERCDCVPARLDDFERGSQSQTNDRRDAS